MDAIWWIVIVLAAVALATLLVWWTRRVVPPASGRQPAPTPRAPSGERVSITLDVAGADPDSPSVTRLVEEVGNRVLASTPEAQEVVVTDRDGAPLGRVVRAETPQVPAGEGEPPPDLPARRRHRPDPTRTERERPRRPAGPDLEMELEPRHLAQRFDLPPEVRQELRDDEDPVELLRAILVAGGVSAHVEQDVVRSGDEVFIVVPEVHGRPAAEGLNHAYHRFRQSGARTGVAISMGYASPREVRRREALEPDLRHVGPSALQRMADAVALGADPRRFALSPSLADNTAIGDQP